jgi:nucleoid-associated protein YgaU
MRGFCALLVLALLVGTAGSFVFAAADEPHWSEVVKTYYPYWKSHYWVDRELWGNQGYIIGGPPKRLKEDEGLGALAVEPVVIKEEPLDVTPTKVSDKPTSHVVKKGECLWYIAGYEQIYGNPLKWPLIYKANKDKIKDPDLIYPGQVLVIPRD